MNIRLSALARATPAVVMTLFAIVCIAGLWRAGATIALRVPLDPNEGWNAYHAAAAIAGRAFYPGLHSLMINNYPPLSFYFVGAIGRAIGDDIIAGRIVSFLSLLVVVMGIFRIVRIVSDRMGDAAMAAFFFAACLLVGSDYVGMDDPQLLGHAIQMTALLLVMKHPKWDVVSGLLFAASLFVKHNLIAMPLAVALVLIWYDRNRALRFVGAGIVSAILGLLAFRLAYGSQLFFHLASARLYSIALLVQGAGAWLVWGCVPVVALTMLLARRPRDELTVFCALYAVVSIAIGIAFAGGAGVDANVFFDADIALSLSIGLALYRLGGDDIRWRAAISAALLVPLFLGLYFASDADWHAWDFWVNPMADEASLAADDIAFLERRHGRAMCETLSLCYWAGKQAEVDVFNIGQAYATHARSDDELVRMIDAQTFSTIEFDTLLSFSLTRRVREALLHAYRIDHADDDGVFFVPR